MEENEKEPLGARETGPGGLDLDLEILDLHRSYQRDSHPFARVDRGPEGSTRATDRLLDMFFETLV
ncbi:hypothetical protein [Polyangium mundeleinium]|uniref:Uncharacterized protein n=1 Tax=Polyangium mundeleinium TaxID=2995306 RepID=A0ABT5F400_9BACT|nr:hypothetical protein [Polyangium mundeleinium]MDC0748836.1 hypothetical protein [Polyangium mundeleinium]